MTGSTRRPGINLGMVALVTASLVSMASATAMPAKVVTWSGKVAPLATPWTAEVSPTNALPDYPRPQLARPSLEHPRWMSLNGLWQFAPTNGWSAPPFQHALDQHVLVPFPIESVLSGVQKHSNFMFYRRMVTIPAGYTEHGDHVRLNFGAVNYDATVYVNGTEVVRHIGAYDAFSADITPELRATGPQEIIVAVHSPVDSEDIPVGKQRLKPSGIFYTASSGIWQSVWIEPVPATSVASLTLIPNTDLHSFTVTSALHGHSQDATLSVTAFANGKSVGHVTGPANGTLLLPIEQPHLWSPRDPFLYTVKAQLKDAGHTDQVASYAGLRTIGVKRVDGRNRIVLNGKPTFLLATLDQGFWPDGIYTAPTDAALKFDIQKTKDLGFNTIRKHIKVEPARWYYWADHIGLMVWQDMPSMPSHHPTPNAQAVFRAQVAHIVRQHRGVTSIIGWIPFNEGWGQWSIPAAAELAAQIKQQDPSRLVDARSGANCCDMKGDPHAGDVIDVHDYQGPGLVSPDATRAAIDGEHGGLTLGIPGHVWPGSPINPYGAVKDRATLTSGYVANTAVLRDKAVPMGMSGSVYTQITDVEGEHNGLFTYDRKVEKVDPSKVRAINQAVIQAGSR